MIYQIYLLVTPIATLPLVSPSVATMYGVTNPELSARVDPVSRFSNLRLLFKVFSPLFRLTFAMYGGLSTTCMVAGNLSQTCNQLVRYAVAKLAVGHVPTIRVGHVARHVRHAAAL